MAAKSASKTTARTEAAAILVAARRARHRAAREATKARKARAAELRRDGKSERANALEAKIDRRNYALIRFRRRQEERELEKFWRPIRVRIEEARRPKFKMMCPAKLYSRFEYGTGGGVGQADVSRPEREIFLQWIGRGFKSGSRAGRKSNDRTGRNRPWRPGEAGRMARYICRQDAVEDIDSSILSNVGPNLEEIVAFFRELENVEQLSRSNASVYHHAIIALPYEIIPSARLDLVNRIVQPLQDLGIGYVAAIHKPDKDGDQRNFHLHIVLSLRPMKRKGDFEWELSPSKTTWLDTPAGLLLLRRHLAREFNRALAMAGSPVRWTHLSRADRGLASPGNTKRRPGDRHQRAVDAAEQQLRQARERQFGIERVGQVVETLQKTVDRVVVQGQALGELASLAAARMRELHRQLLELSEQAARARRRAAAVRSMALRRLKEMRQEAEVITNAAAARKAELSRLVPRSTLRVSPSLSVPSPSPEPAPATLPAEMITSLDRLNALRRQARELYPLPSAANHLSVRSLIIGLRNVDTPDRLRDLAAEIARDPHAVAELRSLGTKMTTEFEALLRQGVARPRPSAPAVAPRQRDPGYER